MFEMLLAVDESFEAAGRDPTTPRQIDALQLWAVLAKELQNTKLTIY